MSELIKVHNKYDLPLLGGTPKAKKSHKALKILGKIFVVLFFSVVFAVSGQITYNYSKYQKFYVNGESMYPTLNRHTEVYAESKRVYVNSPVYSLGDFSSPGCTYLCDFGLMDNSKDFLKKIERFSIVITFYNSDFSIGEGGARVIKEKADLKIKRVIGLPGESLYFDGSGDLFIKKKGESEYQLIAQPFLEIDPWDKTSEKWKEIAKSQTLKGAKFAKGPSEPCVLGEDDYFLCGDNRIEGSSKDSRTVGPIKSYAFVGKAVTITGGCWYSIPKSGSAKEASERIKWDSVVMPWNLRYL